MKIRSVKLTVVTELLGLCLVLLAAGFQLFLAAPLSDAAQEGPLVRLEERIKYVWFYLGEESRTKDPTILRDRYNDLDHSVSEVENWGTRLKNQSNTAKNIYAWMYFVGSVLLLIGRYLELSDKNEQRRPTMPSSGRAKRRRAA